MKEGIREGNRGGEYDPLHVWKCHETPYLCNNRITNKNPIRILGYLPYLVSHASL